MCSLTRAEELVKKKGWTVREFGRRFGKSEQIVKGWKTLGSILSAHLPRVAEILDTTEAYLRGETDDPSPNEDGALTLAEQREFKRAAETLGLIAPDGSIDEERLSTLNALLAAHQSIARKTVHE